MKYNTLGNTGLFVSELCLGTMTFGGDEQFKLVGEVQQAEADQIVKTAIEAGVNFIDTADVYSGGKSETILGQSLRNLKIAREDVIIATKVHGEMGRGPNAKGASRSHIMNAVKASLRRLNTDYIDLYQLHGFDAATPVEESLEALDSLVKQGLVRYTGVSNWPAWRIAGAQATAAHRHINKFSSLQAYYSLASRDVEREIVPMLEAEKLGLMVWSPLAGGLLSGKFGGGQKGEGRRASFSFPPVAEAHAEKCIEALRKVAAETGFSVAQTAIGWLLKQPRVTTVILGAKNVAQLSDTLKATAVNFTDAQRALLDEVSRLPAEYPGWMIEMWGAARREQLAASKPH